MLELLNRRNHTALDNALVEAMPALLKKERQFNWY